MPVKNILTNNWSIAVFTVVTTILATLATCAQTTAVGQEKRLAVVETRQLTVLGRLEKLDNSNEPQRIQALEAENANIAKRLDAISADIQLLIRMHMTNNPNALVPLSKRAPELPNLQLPQAKPQQKPHLNQ
jgi:hypothetical protein